MFPYQQPRISLPILKENKIKKSRNTTMHHMLKKITEFEKKMGNIYLNIYLFFLHHKEEKFELLKNN